MPSRADILDPFNVNFNDLADGATNAQVQAYMQGLLDASPGGASVVVSGAKGERNYDGDGHVVGPCSSSNCNGSRSTGGAYVTPLTLGASDRANMGDAPRALGREGFLDTFLIPYGSYKKYVDGS